MDKKELLILFSPDSCERRGNPYQRDREIRRPFYPAGNFLSDHLYKITEDLKQDKIVFFEEYIPVSPFRDDPTFKVSLQIGEDMGEKLMNAFLKGFLQQYSSVVLVKNDCPGLSKKIIKKSFKKLRSTDFVAGAQSDGNFYLLAMRNFYPLILQDKSWNTPDVYRQITDEVRKMKSTLYEMPVLENFSSMENAYFKRFRRRIRL